MKKIVRRGLMGLGGLLGVFVVVGLVLPTDYEVTRTQSISAPASVIFGQINDLEEYNRWQPWAGPGLEVSYGDKRVGQGASYKWSGEDQGEGQILISKSVPNQEVTYALDFGQHGTANTTFTLSTKGDAVNVVWRMNGNSKTPIVGGYFAAMMDSMVGPYYERGLSSLKKRAESRPQPQAAR